MATAAIPQQQATLARRPGPARCDDNQLCIKLNKELAKSLGEMAKLSHSEVPSFIVELLEVSIADFRLMRIPPTTGPLIAPRDSPPAIGNTTIRRGRLTVEDEDKIVAAMQGEMKIRDCATRWHVGESTIRRVLARAKKRAPSAETVQKIIFLSGASGEEHMSIAAIAKAVGESESVVSRVLSNHRPLVPSSSAVYGRPPRPGGWNQSFVRAQAKERHANEQS